MPDHVHIILKPIGNYDLSRIMKGIKGTCARLWNQYRNTQGSVWQAESYDRIIRDANEFEEKLQYMYYNPVKAGLATDPDKYEGLVFQS